MSLKRRLKKIEEVAGEKNKPLLISPMMIMLYEDDNEEEVFKYLEAKYGEDFKSVHKIIIKAPETREEARENKGLFYKEIIDL